MNIVVILFKVKKIAFYIACQQSKFLGSQPPPTQKISDEDILFCALWILIKNVKDWDLFFM